MYNTGNNTMNYDVFKTLLKGTDVENLFDDKYKFAYIEQEVEFPAGSFVSFRTGYNTDQVITFIKDDDKIFTKSYYRRNYGNYYCRCDGARIRETINYGFGSETVNIYDLHFNLVNTSNSQSYGCCCG